MNTKCPGFISDVKWLRWIWPLQLCCLLRLLLLGPVPLPECSFSWQTSRSSGISNMFGSLAGTQASHNGLSGLQCRASLDIHCQISAALSSCRGGIQDPFLVVCDLCLPPASKASIGWMMFILPTLVTCLRCNLALQNYICSSLCCSSVRAENPQAFSFHKSET